MRTWPALEVGPLQNPDLFQAALLARHPNKVSRLRVGRDDIGPVHPRVTGPDPFGAAA